MEQAPRPKVVVESIEENAPRFSNQKRARKRSQRELGCQSTQRARSSFSQYNANASIDVSACKPHDQLNFLPLPIDPNTHRPANLDHQAARTTSRPVIGYGSSATRSAAAGYCTHPHPSQDGGPQSHGHGGAYGFGRLERSRLRILDRLLQGLCVSIRPICPQHMPLIADTLLALRLAQCAGHGILHTKKRKRPGLPAMAVAAGAEQVTVLSGAYLAIPLSSFNSTPTCCLPDAVPRLLTHPHTLIPNTHHSTPTEGNKAVHLQRPCPVCQGAGRVVSRRKARAMAIEGVITARRRPPGFVMKGPVPPPERIEAAQPEKGEALCYLTGARRA